MHPGAADFDFEPRWSSPARHQTSSQRASQLSVVSAPASQTIDKPTRPCRRLQSSCAHAPDGLRPRMIGIREALVWGWACFQRSMFHVPCPLAPVLARAARCKTTVWSSCGPSGSHPEGDHRLGVGTYTYAPGRQRSRPWSPEQPPGLQTSAGRATVAKV